MRQDTMRVRLQRGSSGRVRRHASSPRARTAHEEVAIVKRTMRSAVVLGVAGRHLVARGRRRGSGCPAQGSGGAGGGPRPTPATGPCTGGDPAGTGFSPPWTGSPPPTSPGLAEAWTYSLAAVDEGARGPNSQVTPIVVGGVMYLPAADRVVALDAATGREIWRHALDGARPSRRGVAWVGRRGRRGPAHHLHDRAAPAGARRGDRGPGRELRRGRRRRHGRALQLGAPRARRRGGGGRRQHSRRHHRRHRQRARLRRAHRRPRCGSSARSRSPASPGTTPGAATAGRAGSGPTRGRSTSRWTRSAGTCTCRWRPPFPATTAATGPATTSTATPSSRWTSPPASTGGTSRPSTTTCGTPTPPAPPALFDIPRDGGAIAALGVTTKSGYLYILDRDTGEPVYGVEERPVAASDVPGEATSPTQPIPLKPAGLSKLTWDPGRPRDRRGTPRPSTPPRAATPRSTASGRSTTPARSPRGSTAPPASPCAPPLSFPGGGRRRQLGRGGGGPGDRLSPRRHPGFSAPSATSRRRPRSTPYRTARALSARPASRCRFGGATLPCHRPPWGRLTAVDAATGDVAWQEVLGVTDGLPEGRRGDRPAHPRRRHHHRKRSRVRGRHRRRPPARLRVGVGPRAVGGAPCRGPGNANPMTYLGEDGRQYVAVAATDTLAVFALP